MTDALTLTAGVIASVWLLALGSEHPDRAVIMMMGLGALGVAWLGG